MYSTLGVRRRSGSKASASESASSGSLVAIDLDAERVDATQASLGEAELAAPVRLFADDIFAMPFGPDSFDLVYSSGLFHELDVKEWGADDALVALRSVARSGGRVVTADFVDSEPAVQLEDEELEAEIRREAYGSEVYGIGPPERLVALHDELFRTCGGGTPTDGDPSPLEARPGRRRACGLVLVAGGSGRRLRERRQALRT